MSVDTEKVALVTGSTSGIGRAVALRFAREGYHVVVTGRNHERGQQVCDVINQSGAKALFIAADMTQRQEVDSLIDQAIEAFGHLDVLVNNAGGNKGFSLENEMATNFYSAVYCCEAATKVMRSGCIVNVASICGSTSHCDDIAGYSAAKAALINYGMTLAKRLAPTIRVNTVSPGYTRTPDWGTLTAEIENRYSQHLLIERFIEPDEIADAVWFMANNKAITGVELVVDGGIRHK